MKIASVADIKARLSAYLKEAEEGPVVVTRNGKAVAVLLAVTDEDELERLVLAHSPKFQALLDKSVARLRKPVAFPTMFSGGRCMRKAIRPTIKAREGAPGLNTQLISGNEFPKKTLEND